MTDPLLVAGFLEESGADLLAVAIGNAHGSYRGEPRLDGELIGRIRGASAGVPLVLHGASGLPSGDLARRPDRRGALSAGRDRCDDGRMQTPSDSTTPGSGSGHRKRGSSARHHEEVFQSHEELRSLAQRRREAEEKLEKHLKEQEALHPRHHDAHAAPRPPAPDSSPD
ncbi:class II fructose-bisphosphate aldolase [Zafaria sp. J156]|uniref:class II fructose-bisphosphate aldolase n=1 Tax=Zafaria sp. J156 TaxID=3116490 RepID=UPI002E7835E0|nr:class II fructose-bisphosphate aldolase [Zafaria sp. J156]MEE1619798.1 class II fructose-bisphosphate aldolase [Zafaria sp. J156]